MSNATNISPFVSLPVSLGYCAMLW